MEREKERKEGESDVPHHKLISSSHNPLEDKEYWAHSAGKETEAWWSHQEDTVASGSETVTCSE